MEFVLVIFAGVIATLITILCISTLPIPSEITADAVLSSIATILTGAIALIAALLSIKNMNKNHKEQIDKILEKNEIEEFFRYKKDFEYNYRSIIENHKKNEPNNYQISAGNIFGQLHEIKDFKGIPNLDDTFINKLIDLISRELGLYTKILENRDGSSEFILSTARAMYQEISEIGSYLYTTDKEVRTIIETNSKEVLCLKVSAQTTPSKTHAEIPLNCLQII
ncbi:hypothetical protein [Thalassolituus oleivorans]|nr:hypothetical protein [Thalassolituus oleivorans]